MEATSSAEDYLETILILSKKLPVVRSVDISNEMNFKKSSVSVAMKNLREKDLITVSHQFIDVFPERIRKLRVFDHGTANVCDHCFSPYPIIHTLLMT